MASYLDTLPTGPIPNPGPSEMDLFVKTRDVATTNTRGTHKWTLSEEVLLSTSKLFVAKRDPTKNHIIIVWPEHLVVDQYVNWLKDRIIHRIPTNQGRPAYSLNYTVLKFPALELEKFVLLVREIYGLVNMWLFGWFIRDVTFMDTVIDTLALLLDEPRDGDDDYHDVKSVRKTFIQFLAPIVVEGIWTHTVPGAKLRTFIIDFVLKYGSHIDLLRFNATKAVPKSQPSPVTVNDNDEEDDLLRPPPRKRTKTGPKNNPVSAVSSSALPIRGKATRTRTRVTRATSEAATEDPEVEMIDVNIYPLEFVKELNRVERGAILVSQLPVDIQRYYDQVRVFLPRPPYAPELIGRTERTFRWRSYEAPVAQEVVPAYSLPELNLEERETLFRNVYREGQTVLRSKYCGLETEINDLDSDDEDHSEGSGSSDGDRTVCGADQTALGCLYHEHTDPAACYMRRQQFRHGEPI
ncbi:hypothetical protein BU23DRAFT_664236 [Bimuria novae-zelandiae CBS 107.79]|uniref:Uncharacterized protein n=1 Tax=Bimuria novae-zelandiae CBS 107.79 TaxID=1447943 RepID=A0A6A5UM90_9PLEO|nr:hypothetical protein BU23DRAFT_664236 [Bimuria novae-zelandiae CBS 107.79]